MQHECGVPQVPSVVEGRGLDLALLGAGLDPPVRTLNRKNSCVKISMRL